MMSQHIFLHEISDYSQPVPNIDCILYLDYCNQPPGGDGDLFHSFLLSSHGIHLYV